MVEVVPGRGRTISICEEAFSGLSPISAQSRHFGEKAPLMRRRTIVPSLAVRPEHGPLHVMIDEGFEEREAAAHVDVFPFLSVVQLTQTFSPPIEVL